MKKQKIQRQRRIRAKVQGTTEKPRLSVYRSNVAVAVQVIDDSKHMTIVGLRQAVKKGQGTKTEQAKLLGQSIAKAALEKKVKEVIFDKGSYAYHGRIKAVAEGAREGGLKF